MMGMKNIIKRYGQNLTFLLIALVALAAAGYFYTQYQKSQHESQLAKNLPQAGDQELKTVVEKVGKLVLLPEGETPTLATVTDKERLSNQSFYKNAENGDKVLIYTKAKKAFLYRPSSNKIIEIAPVTVDPKAATSSTQP